jgi:flagellar hook-length control protein FliK
MALPEATAVPSAPIAPAAQVFADAIHRAATDDAQPAAPDTGSAVAGLAATGTVTTAAVAATGQAQQGALDMRDDRWPQAMVDRIVALRDMAAENDTSIRLVPDALGRIDISLRQDGDTVQVRINAEQAQTRQLIAEAQPRLTELAAERGVKLASAGSSFAGTGAEAQRQAPQQQQAGVPAAPPRARVRTDDSAFETNERVA